MGMTVRVVVLSSTFLFWHERREEGRSKEVATRFDSSNDLPLLSKRKARNKLSQTWNAKASYG